MNLDDILKELTRRFTPKDGGSMYEADSRIINGLNYAIKAQHTTNFKLNELQEAVCNRFIKDNKESY
jgi:hypothetical protein